MSHPVTSPPPPQLNTLFESSVWGAEYNRSEVVGLSSGSLVVRARLWLNSPDAAAAQKLGSAFLRGLQNRHGHEWMGAYSIDITSIRFTEVIVDAIITSPPPSAPSTSPAPQAAPSPAADAPLPPRLDVGWGEWGPWSTCSPCSPQYDQVGNPT